MSEGQYFASPADLDDRECRKPLIDIKGRFRVALDTVAGAAGLALDATVTALSAKLPAALGPTTPEASLSTVIAQSTAVCTWQVTAGTGVLPLVPAWATGATKKVGEPVTANGNVYRCITAGTTAGSGTGPATTGSDITDNTAHWAYVGPVATAFKGGFVAVNIDSTSHIYFGTSSAITTTAGSCAIHKGGGSITLPVSPALLNVIAGASAIVTVTALV